MKDITLSQVLNHIKPGDILLTAVSSKLSKTIRYLQEFQGDEAIYSHVGIFTKLQGTLLEAKRHLDFYSLTDYRNTQICVVRHAELTPAKYQQGLRALEDNIGQRYPYYRLALHLLDNIVNLFKRKVLRRPKIVRPFTSLISFDHPVCSEWIAQFLLEAGVTVPWGSWHGINPDDFDDARLKMPTIFQTVIEGRLTDG